MIKNVGVGEFAWYPYSLYREYVNTWPTYKHSNLVPTSPPPKKKYEWADQ